MNMKKKIGVLLTIIGIFIPLIAVPFTTFPKYQGLLNGYITVKTNEAELEEYAKRRDEYIKSEEYQKLSKDGTIDPKTGRYRLSEAETALRIFWPPGEPHPTVMLKYKYILLVGIISLAIGLWFILTNWHDRTR